MIKMRNDDTTEAIWVRPPVCSWSSERDSDVAFGTQENAPPTMFDSPCEIARKIVEINFIYSRMC